MTLPVAILAGGLGTRLGLNTLSKAKEIFFYKSLNTTKRIINPKDTARANIFNNLSFCSSILFLLIMRVIFTDFEKSLILINVELAALFVFLPRPIYEHIRSKIQPQVNIQLRLVK